MGVEEREREREREEEEEKERKDTWPGNEERIQFYNIKKLALFTESTH